MTDLHHTLPGFSTQPYTHLLPSLERALITTSDILTLDPAEVAKRARLPTVQILKLSDAILDTLQHDLGLDKNAPYGNDRVQPEYPGKKGCLKQDGNRLASRWTSVSSLDGSIDKALGGGVPTGYVTEVTGESGVGKTLFLLTLLLSAQLPPPRGLSRTSIYISTEHPLPTKRLTQLLQNHPHLSNLEEPPSLSKILSISIGDLESQDHILRYQLPVAIERHNIGLVVLDSVATNFRAEFDQLGKTAGLTRRAAELHRLGALLRRIARDQNVAVVVANQVADRFTPVTSMATPNLTIPRPAWNQAPQGSPFQSSGTSRSSNLAPTPNPLTLDHQQRWFTGWGAFPPSISHPSQPSHQDLKTPALGPTWTLQLSARIALYKSPSFGPPRLPTAASGTAPPGQETMGWLREMKVIFAPWAEGVDGEAVPFEILNQGIIGIEETSEENEQQEEIQKGELGAPSSEAG
ncbi:MAG: hypothetical protein M4579_006047 [Chaenotheca gracillima]|nr:MAG: hypothetical protein M4579_006047 [Chaenotheca gracillima]